MPKIACSSINRIEIVEIMETWARYRHGRENGGTGWPKKTILGKLRDGLPTNLCPVCIGREKPHQNCPVCGGDGRVKLEAKDNKANPAFISGNGPRIRYDDDPRSQRVDWLICTVLTEDQRSVVIAEFTWNGNKYSKIRRLHCKLSTYDENLENALKTIKSMLDR